MRPTAARLSPNKPRRPFLLSSCLPRAHMLVSTGPAPPAGGTQSMIWYGSMISHVLQCTQFAKLICSRLPESAKPSLLIAALPAGAFTISYTAAGQKDLNGFAKHV